MGNISRRWMLGATGGLIAGGLLKTQADALTVEAETAPLQTAQADPRRCSGRRPASWANGHPESSPGAVWVDPR